MKIHRSGLLCMSRRILNQHRGKMEQVTFSDLKKMSRTEILAGPCLEITADGLPLGVLVVNPISDMRTRIVGNCSLIDASLGNPPLGGFPKPELKPEPEVELEPVTHE